MSEIQNDHHHLAFVGQLDQNRCKFLPEQNVKFFFRVNPKLGQISALKLV